jgi:hypothetical protein
MTKLMATVMGGDTFYDTCDAVAYGGVGAESSGNISPTGSPSMAPPVGGSTFFGGYGGSNGVIDVDESFVFSFGAKKPAEYFGFDSLIDGITAGGSNPDPSRDCDIPLEP